MSYVRKGASARQPRILKNHQGVDPTREHGESTSITCRRVRGSRSQPTETLEIWQTESPKNVAK